MNILKVPQRIIKEKDEKAHLGAVYFIYTPPRYLKIGLIKQFTAVRLRNRFYQIKMHNPHDLRLHGITSAVYPKDLERQLHQIFSAYHHRGEWFEIAPSVFSETMTRIGFNRIGDRAPYLYEFPQELADGYEKRLQLDYEERINELLDL